jgi:hypothetical protein
LKFLIFLSRVRLFADHPSLARKKNRYINRTRARTYTRKRTNASETESEKETRRAFAREEALVSKQRGDLIKKKQREREREQTPHTIHS